MLKQYLIFFTLFFVSCTNEKVVTEKKKVIEVGRCNKYGTCPVRFSDGTTGLMTRAKVGDTACKGGLNDFAYNKCED